MPAHHPIRYHTIKELTRFMFKLYAAIIISGLVLGSLGTMAFFGVKLLISLL